MLNIIKKKILFNDAILHNGYLSLLKSLKLKKGDEVIVPDVTWTASVSPVVEVGAKPIFVDIESSNWCINPEKLLKK